MVCALTPGVVVDEFYSMPASRDSRSSGYGLIVVADWFVVGRGRHRDSPAEATSGKSCVSVVANCSSAQSTWSLVITSGGAMRIVCSWVSLARMPLPWRASLGPVGS